MKTCPICKAVAFDDADTCYGCLYSFSSGAAGDVAEARPGEPRRRRHARGESASGTELALYVPYEEEPRYLEAVEVPYDYVPVEDGPFRAPLEMTGALDDGALLGGRHSATGVRRRARHAGAMNLGPLPVAFEVSLQPSSDARGNPEWTCTIAAVAR